MSEQSIQITAQQAYRLAKAELLVNSVQSQLRNAIQRLSQYRDLVEFTIEADLTDWAKEALRQIHGENDQ